MHLLACTQSADCFYCKLCLTLFETILYLGLREEGAGELGQVTGGLLELTPDVVVIWTGNTLSRGRKKGMHSKYCMISLESLRKQKRKIRQSLNNAFL